MNESKSRTASGRFRPVPSPHTIDPTGASLAASITDTSPIARYLKTLTLYRISEIYLQEAENAARTKLSYQDYLLRLLEAEVLSKIERSVNAKTHRAGFPQIKHLEEFDFSFQPKINEQLIRELASLDFLSTAKNVLFIGAPGVGKTHLAISLGIKATCARKRVQFVTAEQLTQTLAAAEVAGQLNTVLNQLARIDLLIIDELGYLSLTKQTAKLFFQLVSKRYERGSMIITSNKPFELWGEIFNDEVVAAAILDRLLHHCYPFLINGKSFRMKNLNTTD
jgi:DNA replication protein DnaC